MRAKHAQTTTEAERRPATAWLSWCASWRLQPSSPTWSAFTGRCLPASRMTAGRCVHSSCMQSPQRTIQQLWALHATGLHIVAVIASSMTRAVPLFVVQHHMIFAHPNVCCIWIDNWTMCILAGPQWSFFGNRLLRAGILQGMSAPSKSCTRYGASSWTTTPSHLTRLHVCNTFTLVTG